MIIGPIIFVVWLFCVIDVIQRREDEVRHLPKVAWLVIVLLFPLVGSIAWLLAGREPRGVGSRWSSTASTNNSPFPEYDRPGRASTGDSLADEEFLRQCRDRAEEQRRRYRQQRNGEDPSTPAGDR